ncbi:hypothetical protein E1A91_D07G117100v1 [Gossypium mustelinum]|uniref:SHSP domain-containing protein n=1 Tax=Gossypium mustelinum TaxID=34275 RepID=A0A5D2U906_GOSMU|nr:hypothetical protein E1A91_D07G117100v1 [Gossypium mustelinum]
MAMIPSFFGNRRSSVFDSFSLDANFNNLPFPSSLFEQNTDTSAFFNAQIDWKENPKAHIFKANLPGLKKEEVKVEIEDDRKEDKNDTWHWVERSSGHFMMRFRLPENVKVDQVKASMEIEVITDTVPKVEVKKLDVKAIDIVG